MQKTLTGKEIVKLELSINEVNLILASLSTLPFKDVAQLITKIDTISTDQLLKDEKHVLKKAK